MIEIIPVQGQGFWRARVNFDGTDYLLDFAWNSRAGAWFLTLLTSEETVLVAGLMLKSNRPLFERFRYRDGMPPGELIACDPTETIACAGFDGLGAPNEGGGGVRLIYFEALKGEV
jgi:hypothetical protein